MIQLNLTLNEVNQILEALAEKPYREVFQLVTKIQQQAGSQLQNDNQPAADSDAKPKTKQL